jgi:hypothetical protein
MPRFAFIHSGRPLPLRRALLVLIPVVALATAPALPAGAVDEPAPAPVSDPAPAAAYPSISAIKSWGTAKRDSTSKAQRVNAIVEANGVAYLGGEFTKMRSPSGSSAYRNRLAAIDGTTGDLRSWNPNANGKVWALELAADGQSVYVGGDFSKIGDRYVSKIAKVDLATGQADTTFKPRSVSGRVRALELDGDRLYVGGEFLSIADQARPKLAALDPATGALLAWTPPPLGPGRYIGHTGTPTPDYSPGHVFAIEVIGGKVFAAGNFLNLGGEGGLVTLDAVTGGLAAPQYDPGRPMFDLDTDGHNLFAAGGGPGGRLYAYSPDHEGSLWKAKVDGDAVGVAVSGTSVYLAGHYDYIVSKDSSCYQYCPGGPARRHLSGFATDTGALLPWNPTADTSTGPFSLALGAQALYVGGEFLKINGSSQPGFAIFPGTP